MPAADVCLLGGGQAPALRAQQSNRELSVWLLGLAVFLLAAAAPQASAPPATALSRLGDGVADETAALAEARTTSLGVFVAAPSPELTRAFQTTVIGKLVARRFKSVVAVQAADANGAEARGRQNGLDYVARLQVSVQGPDVTATGDLVPTWDNFWASPQARGPGGGALSARAVADAETFTLAGLQLPKPPRTDPSPLRVAVRLVARIPQRVIAMAAGDLDGDGRSEVALLTADSVLVARADGTVVARTEVSRVPLSSRPSRHAAGSIVIQPTGTGPVISYWLFDRTRGETVALEGRTLRPLGETDAVALCSGQGGVLVGSVSPGRGLIEHVAHPGAPGRFLPEPVAAVAAATHTGGGTAFLAMLPDGSAQLLGADLAPLGAVVPNVGLGSVLADLDGDGQAELVVSQGAPVNEEHLRAFRIGRGTLTPLDVVGDPVAGEVLAGAVGDFDASGHEVAILAAVSGEGTTLYRVGAEP